MREVLSLDDGWVFARTDLDLSEALAGRDPALAAVTLPHSWNAQDGHTGGNDYHRGACWYRREVDVGPVGDRRAVVEFGAAGSVADVYVGQQRVGTHRGGYSIFRCDLTDALDEHGRGILAVRVDNSWLPDVYPLVGDHTVHGGLYRGARLLLVPSLHLDLLDHGSPGVSVEQTSLDEHAGSVSIRARVRNAGGHSVETTVTARIGDDRSTVTTTSDVVVVPAGEVVEVRLLLEVATPHRWDGRRDPHLYRIAVEVDGSGDSVEVGFGFRTFEVDPDEGVHLNGRPYPMRGVSRHHDFEGLGPALRPEHHERDLALIEEIGATAVRLAHYQHDQCFYDLCDRAGLLVWAEIPFNARSADADPEANASAQLRELIAQNRHHPSIVCWGLQNEITLVAGSCDPRSTVTSLHALARELDPTRPTAQANVGNLADDDSIHRIADLDAVNVYSGWYYDSMDDLGPSLDQVRAANPGTPIGLSEYGADAHPAFHASEPTAGDYSEEYQSLLHEAAWRAIDARPWLWCTFVWNMFDFASDRRDEAGVAGRNMKGLVSYDRTTTKDAFHWYRANWSASPVVHICSKRFVHRTEPEITVKVYSNLPDVRLDVDGEDAGPPDVDGRIFRWRVRVTAAGTSVAASAGDVTDEAAFRLVDGPDPSYTSPAPALFGGGTRLPPPNWYERDGIVVDHSIYGTWTPLGELVENPETRAIVAEVMGAEALENEMFEMALGFSFDKMAAFMRDQLTPDVLRDLHRRLSAIPKPTADA